jgi:hypothetical protein
MMLLNATGASWALYQLIFVCAALLAMYSSYAWYEAFREKNADGLRRAKLLLLLAIVTMLATAVVSLAITQHLPF